VVPPVSKLLPDQSTAQVPLPTLPSPTATDSTEQNASVTPEAKRQKVQQPASVDAAPAAQPIQDARHAAEAAKQQLGLTGVHSLTCLPVPVLVPVSPKHTL